MYNEKTFLTMCFAIINNEKNVNKYYLYNYLKYIQNKLMDLGKGTAQPCISMSKLDEIHIPIPSKQIQEHIVKECEYYDNLIETLKKENERLQNNKIIDMVLKSVSNEIDDQQDEISEDESEEETQPTKITKETTKVKEILKQVIEKEALDELHLKKSKESPKNKRSKKEKTTDI
jgi:restriction endonuclease S subunit